MFERYTERARQVVVLAQDVARRMGHNYIGTEHLLHGLAAEGEGLAAKVLREASLTPEKIEEALESLIGRGTDPAEDPIPFTPRAKKVCELALREALSLGHNYIGTEHILLGLVRENGGTGARVLNEASLSSEDIRNAVMGFLMGPLYVATPRTVAPRPLSDAADHALEALRLVNTELERRARENDEINLGMAANQLRNVVASLSQFAKHFEEAA